MYISTDEIRFNVLSRKSGTFDYESGTDSLDAEVSPRVRFSYVGCSALWGFIKSPMSRIILILLLWLHTSVSSRNIWKLKPPLPIRILYRWLWLRTGTRANWTLKYSSFDRRMRDGEWRSSVQYKLRLNTTLLIKQEELPRCFLPWRNYTPSSLATNVS